MCWSPFCTSLFRALENKGSHASWLKTGSLFWFCSQFFRFLSIPSSVLPPFLSAREVALISRGCHVPTPGCSHWATGPSTSSPSKELQFSCLRRLRGFGNPPGSVSALGLHKFSLSVRRMLCPGTTMGIVDVEQSHCQA